MNFKRIDSRCYAAVITEDGQWQKINKMVGSSFL